MQASSDMSQVVSESSLDYRKETRQSWHSCRTRQAPTLHFQHVQGPLFAFWCWV